MLASARRYIPLGVHRFRRLTAIRKSPFFEFHELGELVVNNASLMLTDLCKSLQSDLLLIGERSNKTFESQYSVHPCV